MHYKNHREAHEGDPVVGLNYAKVVAGTLHTINASASSCNGRIAVTVPGGVEQLYCNIGDIFHAEDAFKSVDGKTG